MKRILKCSSLLAVAIALSAYSRPDDGEFDLSSAQSVTAEELATQRGGFSWGGLEISFAANVRTYLGEELVLQTILNVQGGQVERSQLASPSLTQVDPTQLTNGI